VDDASTDDGPTKAARAGAKVIHLRHRQGKGRALVVALEQILKMSYNYVCFMDGDAQHDPSDLDQFEQCAQTMNYDVILGNRMNNAANMPRLRYWVNRLMSWLISRRCRQSIVDSQCGYRWISTELLCEVSPFRTKGFEIESEMLVACLDAKRNIKMTSVSVKTIYGEERSKIRPLRDTFRFVNFYINSWIEHHRSKKLNNSRSIDTSTH
jgi:glycosyltransferase involved in cell wall biosynthesis